jgi:hypothetical protein
MGFAPAIFCRLSCVLPDTPHVAYMDEKELMPDWGFVADDVMGGVSAGRMTQEIVLGRRAHRLQGEVSLDNDGGFIQMAADLPGAAGWDGIRLDICGNGESYDLRLRTDDLTRPWQSFRVDAVAQAEWRSVTFPFTAFTAHKHDKPFAAAALRRIGILAVGRVFCADVAVANLRFYRDAAKARA